MDPANVYVDFVKTLSELRKVLSRQPATTHKLLDDLSLYGATLITAPSGPKPRAVHRVAPVFLLRNLDGIEEKIDGWESLSLRLEMKISYLQVSFRPLRGWFQRATGGGELLVVIRLGVADMSETPGKADWDFPYTSTHRGPKPRIRGERNEFKEYMDTYEARRLVNVEKAKQRERDRAKVGS